MPWKKVTVMDLRREFVMQALKADSNISQLCRQYKIERKTGYKWINRYKEFGIEGLKDQSRRPIHSPTKTEGSIEALVIQIRQEHPAWGPRKIKKYLENQGKENLPATSTMTDILRREGLIEETSSNKRDWQRFEHEAPNRLWQMDFKGDFAMGNGRCYPLTILDDHSRFSIGLKACSNQRMETVQGHLIEIFEHYGMPERINTDNGPPWGTNQPTRYTKLSAWFIQLGIQVSHSRVCHPQTNGKDERFHRTLKAELLKYHYFRDCAHAQELFDKWRECYNLERPHEGIGMDTPALSPQC